MMRRRRNELEYPPDPADEATVEEAEDGLGTAGRIVEAAAKLVANLDFFT